MSDVTLFSPLTLGPLSLKNRAVMAPMTRSRAEGNIPNDLMAEYYGQRAGAGLIITEGTAPSPNGLGYARIPGLFSAAQVEGWKKTTARVHQRGGVIAAQLMHTGRVGHPLNLPSGAEIVAPSAIAAPGEMYTDQKGMQAYPTPRAMNEADIGKARDEIVAAAKNAIAAGFDAVELHGANGYLLEQFLSPNTNKRDDNYGGSLENRLRFVLEVVTATAAAIGGDRLGIRLSPYGTNAGMTGYPETDATHRALVEKLAATTIQYVHVVDHEALGAPPVPAELKAAMRKAFPRTFVLTGGFTHEAADKALADGQADLIGFGRPFLANPDLLARFTRKLPLNAPDFPTFYTPGPKGYTDYPSAE